MFRTIDKAIKLIVNIYQKKFLYKKVKKANFEYALNDKERECKIVISMTSFPPRFDTIDLCFKSICLQTIKPDKILVYLGSDTKDSEIEGKLKKYEKYGFEFIHDEENNYKSHKKYLYAFKEYNDSIIITLDDDLIYPSDLIESLINKYNEYPNCIIARRVHMIKWDDEKIKPYLEWDHECCYEKKPSHMLFATTGAGTLFPPNSMSEDVIDYDNIKEYALTADDVWLKFMELKNNRKVVWTGNRLQVGAATEKNQKINLVSENIHNNKNDQYINKIMRDFNITKKDFM